MAQLKYVLKTRDFTKDFRSSDSAKLALVKKTVEKMKDGGIGHGWYHELHNAIENGENAYGVVLAEIDREAERNRTY